VWVGFMSLYLNVVFMIVASARGVRGLMFDFRSWWMIRLCVCLVMCDIMLCWLLIFCSIWMLMVCWVIGVGGVYVVW